MLTNTQRMTLINRLQVLQQEIANVTQTLIDNPCPLSESELDKVAESILKNGAVMQLSSLEYQLKVGMDDSVLATYHPRAPANKVRAYNSQIDDQTLTVFERLIETGQYVMPDGDEAAEAFCIRIVNGKAAVEPPKDNSTVAKAVVDEEPKDKELKALWEITVTDEEPANPILKIGPNRVVRQKVDGETLEQHLEMCGTSRIVFEEQIAELREKMAPGVVCWVHLVESNLS
jgi:hypothetical protein